MKDVNTVRKASTLVVAAICVYIGADFLWDNLVAPLAQAFVAAKEARTGLAQAFGPLVASWAVLLVCVHKDMLLGTILGVAVFQAAGFIERRCAGSPK